MEEASWQDRAWEAVRERSDPDGILLAAILDRWPRRCPSWGDGGKIRADGMVVAAFKDAYGEQSIGPVGHARQVGAAVFLFVKAMNFSAAEADELFAMATKWCTAAGDERSIAKAHQRTA